MRLTERHYHADRGDDPESYQDIDIIQEAPRENEVDGGRQFIRFTLMETRWRSKKEAAAYLVWASKQILSLPE